MGYSFPLTDVASSILFTEAQARPIFASPVVKVVDYDIPGKTENRDRIMAAYRRIYRGLEDNDFSFDGARAWAQSFVAQNKALSVEWKT